MKFSNVLLLDESFKLTKTDVFVKDGVFVGDCEAESMDCEGLMMLPGLVDIHVHGAVGRDAMDEGFEAIEDMSGYLASKGTTAFLPTIMTESHEKMKNAAANIAKAQNKVSGARVMGIYMEGPYFSMKYKGAQNPEYVRDPDVAEFKEINSASGDIIKVVSIAPEKDGALDFISALKDSVKISAGHTDCGYDMMKKAMTLGLTQLTHTFNAMRGLHHREPGLVCAAIENRAFCECISDGMHVHPAMVRLLYNAVGKERLVLVSDSIRPAGMPDGEYDSGGQSVFVKDGKATLKDGTIAGSSATLLYCVKQAVSFGIPLEDAVRAASHNPAVAAGIDGEVGVIKQGRSADFLLVDKDLELKAVYVGGRKINVK